MTQESLDIINREQWLRHPYSQARLAELEERYRVGCLNLIGLCNSPTATEMQLRCLGGELKAISQLLESFKKLPETTNNKQ